MEVFLAWEALTMNISPLITEMFVPILTLE